MMCELGNSFTHSTTHNMSIRKQTPSTYHVFFSSIILMYIYPTHNKLSFLSAAATAATSLPPPSPSHLSEHTEKLWAIGRLLIQYITQMRFINVQAALCQWFIGYGVSEHAHSYTITQT